MSKETLFMLTSALIALVILPLAYTVGIAKETLDVNMGMLVIAAGCSF